jgi:hypothetical protein
VGWLKGAEMWEIGRWLIAGMLSGGFLAIVNPNLSTGQVIGAVLLLVCAIAVMQWKVKE